jgi:hypothetical protein
MAMQKWEYRRVMFADGRTLDYAANKTFGNTHAEGDAYIALLGAEGWEATGVASSSSSNYTIVFKRPRK